MTHLAVLRLRDAAWFGWVGFWVSLFWVSVVCVLEVCCCCRDCLLAAVYFCLFFSCRSSPSSLSESVCQSVGCCSSGIAGVHHGHKNVSSVTRILSLSMQGLWLRRAHCWQTRSIPSSVLQIKQFSMCRLVCEPLMHVVHTGFFRSSAVALVCEQWRWTLELQSVHLVNCCCRLESLQIVQIRVHSWQSYLDGSFPVLSAETCVQSFACRALPQL